MRTTQYLTPERLKHLDSYSYSSVDKSYVSAYILQPYWRFVASFMPRWLAPNLITAIGFSAILVNVLTVAVFVPDLVGPGSSLVYLSCALGLFFYQTMDAIDGKQARATGTSSPLGEVVDHGFDTLNCPLGGLIQAAALGLGHSRYTLLCTLVGCWSMWFSTWEEYHTGTLYLGYINGPTEGLLIAVAILTTSGVKGPGFWAQRVDDVFGQVPLVPANAQLLDLIMAFVSVAFFVGHLPFCLINVRNSITARQTRALTGRGVQIRLQEAYAQNAPILIFSALSAAWVLSPYSCMLRDQHLIEFAFLVCFLFGQLSSKVIVAQLTKGPFPFSPALLLPLVVPAVGVNLPILGLPALFPHSLELLYLHVLLVLSFVSYLTSATMIVNAFCSYLNISAFVIPYSPAAVKMETRRRSDTSAREEGVARKVARL